MYIFIEKKCVFVGYSNTQKEYKCYSPTSKKIILSHDVTFNELKMFYQPNQNLISIDNMIETSYSHQRES